MKAETQKERKLRCLTMVLEMYMKHCDLLHSFLPHDFVVHCAVTRDPIAAPLNINSLLDESIGAEERESLYKRRQAYRREIDDEKRLSKKIMMLPPQSGMVN
jgi:hypothetical protein